MSKIVTDRKHYESLADAAKHFLTQVRPGDPRIEKGIKPEELTDAFSDAYYGVELAAWWDGYGVGEQYGQQQGYSAGLDAGKTEGLIRGETEGKQAQYDWFWDIYQDNGKRSKYEMAFAGPGWTDETFQPKYPVKVIQGFSTFRMCNISNLNIVIKDANDNASYLVDFSSCLSFNSTFAWANTEVIGLVDAGRATSLNLTFAHCNNLKTIVELILNKSRATTFPETFVDCYALENIKISGQGYIQSSINLQWSKLLTPESMKSIITHLVTWVNPAQQYQQTVTFAEECWEALEADSKSPDETTWRDYVDSKGWLI